MLQDGTAVMRCLNDFWNSNLQFAPLSFTPGEKMWTCSDICTLSETDITHAEETAMTFKPIKDATNNIRGLHTSCKESLHHTFSCFLTHTGSRL